jgi:chromate transporter
VNAASLALMAVVTWQLFASAVVDLPAAALDAAAAILLWRSCVPSTWLVLGGAAADIAISFFR